VHPYRWTSLGLALIEAMLLGLPVVCLATTEAAEVVPPCAGAVSNDLHVLQAGLRALRDDPERARRAGREARRVALERFSHARFLGQWDELLARVAA
jgi:glycosyltransferase involved in cell wall biosynthesis